MFDNSSATALDRAGRRSVSPLATSDVGRMQHVTRVHVDVKPDHLARLARRGEPVRAVEEMIWNSLDADATDVSVTLQRNELDGVEEVIVADNGDGMPPASCKSYFGYLGGSWKATARLSPRLKRTLHGREGQGRFRAFALGDSLRWTTVAIDLDGKRFETVISTVGTELQDFDISKPTVVPDSEGTGTILRASGGAPRLNRLGEPKARQALTVAFAPFLTSHSDVRLTYDGKRIDPAGAQTHLAEFPLELEGVDPVPGTATPFLRVVEWNHKVDRELLMCDDEGVVLDRTQPGIQAPDFNFTAYLLWAGFQSESDRVTMIHLDDGPGSDLLAAARVQLRDHFRSREQDRRREQVERWQAEKIYPYESDPDGPSETVERELFDSVAVTVARRLPGPSKQKKVALRLLREAVVRQPEHMLGVLDELFNLPVREKEQLTRLLDPTSLAAVVRSSTHVADRLDFLRALSDMVFNPELRKRVKERSQLHRILAGELWVFGEGFNLLADDESLTTVLKRHRHVLGLEDEDVDPVLREDGTVGIVDLVLGQATREGELRRHLVIELRAPSVPIGDKELAQIKSYGQAVVNDPQFQSNAVEWDFMIISTSLSKSVALDAKQKDSPRGLVATWDLETGAGRVWAMTWSQIIDDCEQRLKYYRDHLEHDPSAAHGWDYMEREHSENIPERNIRRR